MTELILNSSPLGEKASEFRRFRARKRLVTRAVTPKDKRFIKGKVTLKDLAHVDFVNWPIEPLPLLAPAHIQLMQHGLRYDLLWRPTAKSEGAKRLFVLFSGNADRTRHSPPVFQRWSWASRFPGNCVYVSDPALWLHEDLGIGWYAGTEHHDPIPEIAAIISRIASERGIENKDIVAYASSGGAFAAMRLASAMPGVGVVAINPQVVVTDYRSSKVSQYLSICFPGRSAQEALAEFPDRLSLLPHVPRLMQRPVIYMQNLLDRHHVDIHYSAFCKAAGTGLEANETRGLFRRILFEDPEGHRAAETREAFLKALRIVTMDTEWNSMPLTDDIPPAPAAKTPC